MRSKREISTIVDFNSGPLQLEKFSKKLILEACKNFRIFVALLCKSWYYIICLPYTYWKCNREEYICLHVFCFRLFAILCLTWCHIIEVFRNLICLELLGFCQYFLEYPNCLFTVHPMTETSVSPNFTQIGANK